MSKQPTQDEQEELEREVKEFGNGGHIILPGDYIGETVTITQTTSNTDSIQPPITRAKITDTLTSATRDDFTKRTREDDHYPREGKYEYDDDLRLSIDVELVKEGDGSQIIQEELGNVVHRLHDATSAELVEHTEWWSETDSQQLVKREEKRTETTVSPDDVTVEPVLLCIDPAVSELFDHAGVMYGDTYRYSVRWNESEIGSVLFRNRQAKNGQFYIPYWEEYESLEEYQSSFAYALATALSEAPAEEYNKYLQAMRGQKNGENNDSGRSELCSLSHEEKLEQTIICEP